MKKNSLLLIFTVLLIQFATAQSNWRNGRFFTPKEDLHILVIFASSDAYRIADGAGCNTIVFPDWHPSAGMPDIGARTACTAYYYNGTMSTAPPVTTPFPEAAIIPNWAMAEGFINSDKANINNGYLTGTTMPYVSDPQFNISSYFKTMSFGKFNVTGDVRGVVIPSGILSSSQFTESSHEDIIVDEAFSQLNLDPARYDKRQNNIGSSNDFNNYNAITFQNADATTPTADGNIDYVVIIKKSRLPGSDNAGYVDFSHNDFSHNLANVPSHDFSYMQVLDKTKDSKWDQMGTFIHEFAHNLNIFHNGGSNAVVYDKFNVTEGWGMITNPISQFWTATAHSMWLFGWLNDNEVMDISSTTNNIVLSDLLTSSAGSTKAVRIHIPFTEQYLWIENHQKIHPSGFDQPTIYTGTPQEHIDYTTADPGIYMYISDKQNDLSNPTDNKSSNNIILLHPDGKNDYEFSPTADIPDKLIRSVDNPIAGSIAREPHRMDDPTNNSHLNTIKYYGNYNDGNLGPNGPTNEHYGLKYNASGLRVIDDSVEQSAFAVGDELSINGIYPILNVRRFNENGPQENPPTRQQEPFTLTGLKVKVESKTTTNGVDDYTLSVSYDDWTFESDKRWCDAINIPGNETLTLTNQSNLDLELSGTVNRTTPYKSRGDALIKDFVDPTILTAKPGSTLLIENNSCLNAIEESILKIDNGANLVLNSGGFIHVKDEHSKLILRAGAELHMEDDSFIEIKDGGTLELHTSSINLQDENTRIIIEDGGILTSVQGVPLNFSGLGKLIIKEGAIIDIPFDLSGEGPDHTALVLSDDPTAFTNINMNNKFYVSNCKIAYGEGASITINDSRAKFTNVILESSPTAGNTPIAFTGNNLKQFECKNSTFIGFNKGIVLNGYIAYTETGGLCPETFYPIFKVENSHFEDFSSNAITCEDIYELYAIGNTFAGTGDGAAIHGLRCDFELIDNTIDNFFTGIYLDGAQNSKALKISGGEISNCHTGVRALSVNSTIKYCANIHNNTNGVYSSASSISQKSLTIGVDGGTSITNNATAIKGDNIILDIDTYSSIDEAGNYHPNDFSANNVFFDLSYPDEESAPSGLSVRGNYWGSMSTGGAGGTVCGASIHDINDVINVQGSYVAQYIDQEDIDDQHYLKSKPDLDCSNPGNACGLVAPDTETGTLTTNFNLIYAISTDYFEEEAYNNALFGFSLLAEYEDEPVYDFLAINDQNKVVLSRVQEETLTEFIDEDDGGDSCREDGEDPSLLFPKVEIVENSVAEIKLIESVSPNPFNDAIQLVTLIKQKYKVEIFNAYANINGKAIKQLKANTPKLKIDVSDLKPGVYVLKVTDKEGRSDHEEILKIY